MAPVAPSPPAPGPRPPPFGTQPFGSMQFLAQLCGCGGRHPSPPVYDAVHRWARVVVDLVARNAAWRLLRRQVSRLRQKWLRRGLEAPICELAAFVRAAAALDHRPHRDLRHAMRNAGFEIPAPQPRP